METRRLVLTLTAIAVGAVVVIGGLAIALGSGGGGGGPADESPGLNLPDRIEGELRLFGPDPITLDPACAADAGSAEYIVEIFSGLVSFDRDLNIIPDIAEALPKVSDDGTVYTFTLRRNVNFHDSSRRVVAGDFKYSMERALHPDTLSTVGPVYLDDIVGAKAYNRGDADEVAGIKAVDDSTLQITIDAPKSYFLAKMTYPTAYVVDRREVDKATCFADTEWTRSPNGTGPFEMKEWVLGQRIELQANPDFYLEPKPSLSQVTYILSGGSPLVMYENDEIDLTGVGINDIERIRDPNEPLNKELVETQSLDTFYIGINVKEPPLDDPKVRQALAMAIDRDLIATELLLDLVVPAKGILPPGMLAYNESLEGLEFNPTRARELLDEAGGPEVLRDVTLLATGRGASPGPVLDAIVALWNENLGVDIAIEQTDFAVFQRDIKEGNYQISSQGWIADYVDPQDFLDIHFHSDSPNNETGYSSAKVDDLLEKGRTESDAQKRIELYQQAEEIVVQDAPWIPLSHGKSSVLIKPYVRGYIIPPFVIPNLRYVTLQR